MILFHPIHLFLVSVNLVSKSKNEKMYLAEVSSLPLLEQKAIVCLFEISNIKNTKRLIEKVKQFPNI